MCLADVSLLLSNHYDMFDNCVPQRQFSGCSVTRPFLSLQKGVACETNSKLIERSRLKSRDEPLKSQGDMCVCGSSRHSHANLTQTFQFSL